ncbi:gamma carbonic anhydrase family protein [Hoeflea prorocentri]|uniref:Gamma carbonic anhydrase family protein n=1 Tax=Hoeflea prorocentri TaxID=1922333 RepID=A0A9X3UGT9_9HYPH|nr:gamma carbonic anhydrase family protein [Hoeflea prorocentri]MCY6380396.1 gamma carbonic anhydrase family protein [Hoeflea prorocentri]MDA5398196.1 gamma carbonic anhydrase family protein [Hoeflea prorocentri]
MPLYSLGDDRPSLPEGFHWIADTAVLIGKITVYDDVGIWFGSVLRGDNEPIVIGQGSNIQENCVLHTDMGFPLTVGAGCTIGHKAMLHGCTIGDNSLVGMGATVLNGARIGNNCLIGAGALVTEGKEIPDNSLVVGSPGKPVRELDEKAVEMLRWSARHYVDNARRFANGLKRIDP